MMPGSICICKCIKTKFQTGSFLYHAKKSLENQDYLMDEYDLGL